MIFSTSNWNPWSPAAIGLASAAMPSRLMSEIKS
jgi:hypothetical protein